MAKTLLGKKEYLFLQNDSAKELEVHCNNLNLVNDKTLSRYDNNIHKYFIVVYPNKSFVYKHYLPDEYKAKFRPALQIYSNKFNDKLLDGYKYLNHYDDVYYKTDTHINVKGNYIIYKKFIEKINKIYNLNLKIENINIKVESCKLVDKNIGIGDLTWASNLGNQILDEKSRVDNFYYSDDIPKFYYNNVSELKVTFLNYKLKDESHIVNNFVTWEVLSDYIIYKKNNHCNHKVVLFYDSFLISIIPLFFNLFNEIFLIKNNYDNELINLIKPDYIFEFRVERFLF